MSADPGSDTVLMTLVESALARPVCEREQFLETVRTSHPDIFEEVLSRVRWEERMGGFLHEPILKDAAAPESIFRIGDLVASRFLIVRELGRGGMGIVYKAADRKLDRTVAIKCAGRNYRSRLTPEARAALEVSHPNVCKLHELHTAETLNGPVDFLTMELIEGETLSERLQRDGPLSPKQAKPIALQICAGLAQAHKQGVIHGDLKTGNIILSKTPEGATRAVLMDFGLAHFGQNAHGPLGGTPNYMAPEMIEGAPTSIATDVFALGVLFQRMLGTTTALPRPWGTVISRCTAREPAKRFQSVAQIAAVLDRRRSVVRWLLAAALLVIAALAVWIGTRPDTGGPPVRLAVLPVAVEGAPIPTAAGLGADIADRLSGVRARFTVLAPSEAQRDKVDTVAKAKAALGATHVLRIALKNTGSGINAAATVIETASGQVLKELHGDYAAQDQAVLARALLGTVTGALKLRAGLPRESVSGAGYAAYVQGGALMDRDTASADEAIPWFRKAIEGDPRSALPWAGLAQAQLQKFHAGAGQQWLDDAEASADKAKSMNPDAVPVLLAVGSVEQEHGRYEAAIADFSRATEVDPRNTLAWERLARAYEKTNRTGDADATYRKAIAAQPDSYWPHLAFGNYYLVHEQLHEAEDEYRNVTALAPGFAAGHANLGSALLDQGKYDEAEKSLLLSLNLRRTAPTLTDLGVLYYIQEKFSEAARYYRESLAVAPTTIRYENLGDALRHLGQQKEALNAYSNCVSSAEADLSRDPRDVYSRSQLALCSIHTRDFRRAEFEIAQTLAVEPENGGVIYDSVLGYELLGQRNKAIEALRRAPRDVLEELNRQPDMKRLRADSRFQDMMQRMQPHQQGGK